jgi:hypothetical protein
MNLGTEKYSLGTKKGSSKALKGSVSLQVLPNTTRFKYRYQRKAFYLTVPRKTEIPALLLEQIRKGIEADVLNNEHDNTQQKYKQWLEHKRVEGSMYQETLRTTKESPLLKLSLYEQLLAWSKATNRTNDIPIYHYAIRMVKRWVDHQKDVSYDTLPSLLKDMKYAANTFNTRKYVINLFCSWLVKKKVIEVNPFDDVVAMRKSKAKDAKRKRLSDLEINEILKVFS